MFVAHHVFRLGERLGTLVLLLDVQSVGIGRENARRVKEDKRLFLNYDNKTVDNNNNNNNNDNDNKTIVMMII